MRKKIALLAAMLAPVSVIPLMAADTGSDVPDNITPPKAETSLETLIPNDLKHLHIDQPYVDFRLLIDETGNIKDRLPIESNHYGLLEAATKVIEKAKFTPATLNEIPTPIQYQVRVSFRDFDQEVWNNTGQLPMGSNVMDGTESRMYSRNQDQFIYGQCEVKDLDHPLQVIQGALVVMEDEAGNAPQGDCVIEFYIDPEGAVRLPRVIQSDNEQVSMSAIGSLSKLVFSKPTHNQNPTFVKVRQKFHYGEKGTPSTP